MKGLYFVLAGALLTAGCISPELRSARIAVNERDWQRAIAQLEGELHRVPRSPEAYYLLGFCYERLGDLSRMSQYYDSSLACGDAYRERIVEARRTYVARYYRRFLTEFDSSRWSRALELVDSALVVDPRDRELYQQASIAAYYGDQYDRALNYGRRALGLENPASPDVPTREILMSIAHSRKEDDEAIRLAREIVKMVDPTTDSAEAYLRAFDVLVGFYEEKGDYAAAESAIREVMAFYPGRTDIKKNLALMMLRRENIAGAKSIYVEILRNDSEDFDSNLNLGTILANESDWTGSIPYLLKAHLSDPGNLIAIRNLMAAYFNSDQVEEGLKMKAKLDALEGGG
ncbi:MAG: tetratricopeptide repeat protein [Calditrichaeota bacterium]|nr:tetratricopeptide repeat protein [Calditrichota bacterium]